MPILIAALGLSKIGERFRITAFSLAMVVIGLNVAAVIYYTLLHDVPPPAVVRE